jgi:hypothetical protein
MEPIQRAITGTEDQGSVTTPYQALVQFYDAFNRRDAGGDGSQLGAIGRSRDGQPARGDHACLAGDPCGV